MSFAVEGGADICLVECHDEVETMPPDAVEMASAPDVKSMEVESEETSEEMTKPNIKMLGP